MANITHISQLDLTKRYTYADYLTWSFDERLEIIKGNLRPLGASPGTTHQQTSSRLLYYFSDFIRKYKNIAFFHAPLDVRLFGADKYDDATTVVQPDLLVVLDKSKIEEIGCNGAPDLIIEILSTFVGSKHDLVTKYNLYEEAGVGEYWIVYPYEGVIDVYHLQNQKYYLHQKYTNGDNIDVKTLPGLVINMDDLFYEDVV